MTSNKAPRKIDIEQKPNQIVASLLPFNVTLTYESAKMALGALST
jgi:hypothetical protein